jgi:hypothetical protein
MSAIWNDPDFLALEEGPQRLYMFLLSQPDLSHAGLVPLRIGRWAKKVAGGSRELIQKRIDTLAETRFVVVDDDTEELLIRTFVRNDGVYKQPKVMLRLREDAKQIESAALRAAFRTELDRLPLHELSTQATGRNGDGPSTFQSVSEVVDTLRSDFAEVPEYPSEGVSDTRPDTPRVRAGAFHQPPTTSPLPPTTVVSAAVAADATRDDVERVCEHLARRVEENGSKRPEIGQRWRDAARLMIDRDGRTEHEIHGAIDWSQADEFWRSNILSLPKLREQYDTLRLQAQRKSGGTSRNEEWKSMQERQMARAVAREQEMGIR